MKKLNIGIAGLGRLGKEHANNLSSKIKHANLVAVCSLVESELEYARNELEVEHTYNDFDKLLDHPGLEAVCVVTSSSTHSDCVIKALEKGKHVFCEKPLALSVADCLKVKEVSERHPELKLSVGFNRRYDVSYYEAWQHIQKGDIGKPFMIYQQTVDMDKTAEFQIPFSKTSGGFIVDANIHDIDLVHWLMDSRISEVYAVGGAYCYPKFADSGDVDNINLLARLENGASCVINGSRTAFHAHATGGFIRGTKGEMAVGRNLSKNRLETFDSDGVRFASVETFFERFKESFELELESYAESVLKNKALRVTLTDAINATEAAFACKEAYETGKLVTVKYTI